MPRGRPRAVIEALQRRELIDGQLRDLYQRLSNLRNVAVHRGAVNITQDEALEYRNLAWAAVFQLNRPTTATRSSSALQMLRKNGSRPSLGKRCSTRVDNARRPAAFPRKAISLAGTGVAACTVAQKARNHRLTISLCISPTPKLAVECRARRRHTRLL